MKSKLLQAAAAGLFGVVLATAAQAQKSGGVLRVYHNDNPPTASLHEEVTIATLMPFMALFNNLVIYDQAAKQNTDDTIVPDLARVVEVEPGQHRGHFQAARRGEVATTASPSPALT